MWLEKQDEEEFEMLLDEIPHATSLPHQRFHEELHQNVHKKFSHVHRRDSHGFFGDNGDDGAMSVGTVSDSLWCEGSTSSSPSQGGSPPPPSTEYRNPVGKTHFPNGFWISRESDLPESPLRKNVERREREELGLHKKPNCTNGYWMSQRPERMMSFNGSSTNELSLSDKLSRMHIGDKGGDTMAFDKRATIAYPIDDSHDFWFDHPSLVGSSNGNVVMSGLFEDSSNGFSSDGSFRYNGPPNSMGFDEEKNLLMLGLRQQYHSGNLSGSCLSSHPSNATFPYYSSCTNPMNFASNQPMKHPSDKATSALQLHTKDTFGRNCCYPRIQVPNTVPAVNGASITDRLFCLQQNGYDSSGDHRKLNSLSSSHMKVPNLSSGVGNLLSYSLPMFNDRVRPNSYSWTPQSPLIKSVWNIEAFSCEDSLIIRGKDLNFVTNDGHNLLTEQRSSCHEMHRGHLSEKNSVLTENGHSQRLLYPSILPPSYNSLQEIEGYIYLVAKDQHGCRFLQQKFDERTPEDVQMIFNEVIDHVVELMMDPFGNYLMQKLLDVCTEEQRMKILLVVTREEDDLVKISLNTHGTRAVQKLIETLKTEEQISLAISALKPLELIKDLNGNHVVQRCLQCLSVEYNKFIFDAAAKYCVEIATHRHGCCVLQRCIAHSTGDHQENLAAEISSNGLLLAQDAFGNYVVQYILDLKIPLAIVNLISQFEGNYVHLSMQKFSSNVVEKCLIVFGEESRARIIHELLASSRFEQLLQDPFANYVIQSALEVSKGHLHASLVQAIQPFASVLRTSPYCKRIFLRTFLKK